MGITEEATRGARSATAMCSAVDNRHGTGTDTHFETVTLGSPDGTTEAEFVPAANMVCCSFRYRGTEILHQGAGVEAYARRGWTMGIPLLHPWANRLASYEYRAAGKHVILPRNAGMVPDDGAGLPIHGVLPGLMRWAIEQRSQHSLSSRLGWTSQPLLELFPFAHELALDVTVANGMLTMCTTLAASAGDSVPVSFGYHPYLRVPRSHRQDWQIHVGAFRRLVLDEKMIPTGEREPVAQRMLNLKDVSLDDGFDALAVPPEFKANAHGTGVAVEFVRGYPYAQIYAPAGSDFVCFEPMTAPTNALNSGDGLRIVEPGETHEAIFKITVADARGVDGDDR
jgi:aldose 1-epimerase